MNNTSKDFFLWLRNCYIYRTNSRSYKITVIPTTFEKYFVIFFKLYYFLYIIYGEENI